MTVCGLLLPMAEAPVGAEESSYDYLFKLILIGDAGIGKSCLLHQFLEGRFFPECAHTIGVEFGSRIISLNGKRIKLQIWDTAGQERYRSVTRSYYRGAMGALVLYDVTNRESYDHIPNWIEEARSLAARDVVVMLIGNKVDLADAQEGARQVPFLESSGLAQEHHTMLLESSARTGASVEEIFMTVSKSILNKRLDQVAADEREARPDVVKLKKEWRSSPCDGVKC